MKKLLLPLIATAALAVPASASAWFGHDHGFLAWLSGTGTSFASPTATASGSIVAGEQFANGHFAASLSSNWSAAVKRTFDEATVSCAPATASLTLSDGTKTTATLTGKTCTWTHDGTTKYAFFGRDTTTGMHAFLRESGTAVHGIVFRFEHSFEHH